jgi:hypothetical protein
MLSSAIPARLEYQCGHAALVSLPRIKGETSSQRNERVALEKRNAQLRVCDFCAPRLEEVAPVLSAAAPSVDVEPVAPQGELLIFAAAEPAAPVAPIAEPVVSDSPIPEPPVEPLPSISVPPTPEPERVAAGAAVPRRKSAAPVAPRPKPVVAVTSPARVKPAPRPRAAVTPAASLLRFEIRFETERVLQATNIRDALRQAELLGATEVLGVSLIDGAV